ncbi:hypothetical protein AMTRI_Chr02g262120 [Amborella trichopoda]
MSTQSEGNYVEALQNYYEATRTEIDPYDRSYILYNIGLIHKSNGEHTKALECYFRKENRIIIIKNKKNNNKKKSKEGKKEKISEYWKHPIALTPCNYIEAHNWLKITRRFE